ncbi:RidA family protein [Mumia sp. DW29H23]|uniref:RidA family protein n=1 Tax=Mumia sp. DW29H23 TaxID=3421241 RepID=UPI003D691DCF
MNEIALLSPEGLVQSPAFSHVAVVPPSATTIHVGGQNAVDPTGTVIGGDDVAAQVSQTLDNVETALAAAGAGLSDTIAWSVLMVDGADLQAAYAVVASRLVTDGPPPLVTFARVSGLGVPGALVEVTVTAAVVR